MHEAYQDFLSYPLCVSSTSCLFCSSGQQRSYDFLDNGRILKFSRTSSRSLTLAPRLPGRGRTPTLRSATRDSSARPRTGRGLAAAAPAVAAASTGSSPDKPLLLRETPTDPELNSPRIGILILWIVSLQVMLLSTVSKVTKFLLRLP